MTIVVMVTVRVMEREGETWFMRGPNRMSHALECTATFS